MYVYINIIAPSLAKSGLFPLREKQTHESGEMRAEHLHTFEDGPEFKTPTGTLILMNFG